MDAVYDWLTSAGVNRARLGLSANKQWVSVDMTVSELEDLLRTEYYHYEHGPTGKKTVACDEYHVPAHIQEHVDYITPGLRLMAGGKSSRAPDLAKRGALNIGPIKGPGITSPIAKILEVCSATTGSTGFLADTILQKDQTAHCGKYATPACIAGMYNITKGTLSHADNKMGIFEEGDFYTFADLKEFFTLFAPTIPLLTKPVLHGVDGGFAPGVVATGESDLDLQIS